MNEIFDKIIRIDKTWGEDVKEWAKLYNTFVGTLDRSALYKLTKDKDLRTKIETEHKRLWRNVQYEKEFDENPYSNPHKSNYSISDYCGSSISLSENVMVKLIDGYEIDLVRPRPCEKRDMIDTLNQILGKHELKIKKERTKENQKKYNQLIKQIKKYNPSIKATKRLWR